MEPYRSVRLRLRTYVLVCSNVALAVAYNRAHVQSAAEYARERAGERGWPWACARTWAESLRANGVEHMSSGMLLAVALGGAEGTRGLLDSGRSLPLDGGGGCEHAPLHVTAEAEIRSLCDELLRLAESAH